MFYERATARIKDTTKEGLRSFYEKVKYRLLRAEHKRVFANLIALADFWNAVADQDEDRFSQRVLKRLFVLNYAPNSAWTIITSVYFMHNKRPDGTFDEEKFYTFLGKITGFIWSAAIMGSSVNHLRTPLYKEMVSIISGSDVTFEGYKFDFDELKNRIQKFSFSGRTKITRSMLAWWAMQDHQQSVLSLTAVFETEHISKKGKTINPASYEMLGNKSLLESKIKSAASAFGFSEKIKYYDGSASKKKPTELHELLVLAETKSSFNVKDINQRNKKIIESFMNFVAENNLLR